MASFHIGKGIVSTAASAWTRQASTLLLYTVAARVLTPDQVGLVALSTAIVLLFEYGVFDSLSEALVQRVILVPSHVGSVLAMSSIFAVMVAAFGWVSAPWVGSLFAMPDLPPLLRAMAIGVAIICLSAAHAAILRREGRFHAIAALATIAAVTAAAAGAALLLAGFGISAMITYFLLEKIILCVGTIWLARTQPLGSVSMRHAYDLLPYAAAISGQRMASYARGQMDRVVIGVLWGAGALGAYQMAGRIFDALNAALIAPTSKLFFVGYTKLQRSPAALRAMFLDSMQAISIISFPAYLGLSAVAAETIVVLFGNQWESSAIILEVLGFGGLALTLSTMSGALLSAAGRPRDFLFVEVVATLIGLALLIFFSRFSIAWMAAAFVLREGIAVAIYARLLRRTVDLPVSTYLGSFVPCLAAAVVMWFAVKGFGAEMLTDASPLVRLIAKMGVGAVVYGLLMLLFGRSLLTNAVRLFGSRQIPHGSGA